MTWELKVIPITKLRKSPYNPRIVQDNTKAQALLESIRHEGVREPLLVWPNKKTGEYEVIDGGRRLWALKALGINEAPCIVLDAGEGEMKRASLSIHLTKEDLTPEEMVNFIDRLIKEEEFKSIEEVCRYYGLSKQWYYELKKAVKIRQKLADKIKHLPVSTLAVIEAAEIPREKKDELINELSKTPLPRAAVKQIIERMERNEKLTPKRAIEQQLEMEPKKVSEGYVEAEGKYIYRIKREGEKITFSVSDKNGAKISEITFPYEDMPLVKRMIQEI